MTPKRAASTRHRAPRSRSADSILGGFRGLCSLLHVPPSHASEAKRGGGAGRALGLTVSSQGPHLFPVSVSLPFLSYF